MRLVPTQKEVLETLGRRKQNRDHVRHGRQTDFQSDVAIMEANDVEGVSGEE